MSERRLPAWSALTPAHALTGAIILVAAGLLASWYQDQVFRAQRARELRVQGEILAASVTAALVFDDTKTVQEHVSALAINAQIAAAAVYGNDRRLVAGYARPGIDALPPLANELSSAGGSRSVAIPVVLDGASLGSVFIRPIEDPWLRRLTRHVPMMLLAVMAALLVAILGTSQRALREANAELEARAVALAETNRLLQTEMEERSKAEEALRQSQKLEAIGRLAGGVAHDFNNLLTIIQGNLHLLRRTDISDEGKGLVGAADDAAVRAGNLVRRLLAFSRQQTLSPRTVDLNELAGGMKELIMHSVGDGVRVDWQLGAKWKTLCDANQMENVILNLAINARDAMPSGGTLTIATRDVATPPLSMSSRSGSAEYVELRMRDTGMGMTEEVRRRAVDPFFTTKPHGKGTGLGLSTAFAFVRQSNGQMNIESAPGKGTSIVILLPRHHDGGSAEVG